MNQFVRLFDSFSAPLFKIGPQGELLYFPMGIWGAGYKLPDAASADALRKRVTYSFMIYFLIGIPVLTSVADFDLLSGLPQTLFVIFAVGTAFLGWLYWLARGLSRSNEVMTYQEARVSHMKALGPFWSRVVAALNLIFVALGVVVIAFGPDHIRWIGWVTVAFFGGLLAMFVYNQRAVRRDAE